MIKYYTAYVLMLLSFGYLGFSGPTMRDKIIGFLCVLLNGLIFWRG